MKLKFEMTKKNMIIGALTVSAFGLVTYSYLATNREEAIIAKEEVIESSESTVESTTESSEVEEVIEKEVLIEIRDRYERILIQNDIVLGYRGNSLDIFDSNLNEINSISNLEYEQDELAHTANTENHISGTAVILNEKDAIYSTYIDTNGELNKIHNDLTESNPQNIRLGLTIANPYNVFPTFRTNSDGQEVDVLFRKGNGRERNFSSHFKGSSVGNINENGLFPIIQQLRGTGGSSTFLQFWDANALTEETALLREVETTKLVTVSNLNKHNKLIIQQYTTDLSDDPMIWTYYDYDTGTSYNFPSNISLIMHPDNYLGDSFDPMIGQIGNSTNLVYVDLNEAVTKNDETPSNIDFTPRKQGIISPTGEIIKEPFALEIGKANSNGIAPYRVEPEGLMGIINTNTGEIVREPFADRIEAFNENGLSVMGNNSFCSIIDENGDVVKETQYAYLSPLNDDNIASYRAVEGGDLGIVKVDVE